MTNPNGHRYHLTLTARELSTVHHAILQTRAAARRRLRRGCRRCQLLFDAAQAMHRRLLPLRAKRNQCPTTLDSLYNIGLTGHDLVHLSLALSVSSRLFRHGRIEPQDPEPRWATDGDALRVKVRAHLPHIWD